MKNNIKVLQRHLWQTLRILFIRKKMKKDITLDALFELSETSTLNQSDLSIILLLLEATNDWPFDVKTVQEYYSQFEFFIGKKDLTKEIILKSLQGKVVFGNTWKLESSQSLLEALDVSGRKNVRELFEFVIELSNYKTT